jgi:hypothetical protein
MNTEGASRPALSGKSGWRGENEPVRVPPLPPLLLGRRPA